MPVLYLKYKYDPRCCIMYTTPFVASEPRLQIEGTANYQMSMDLSRQIVQIVSRLGTKIFQLSNLTGNPFNMRPALPNEMGTTPSLAFTNPLR